MADVIEAGVVESEPSRRSTRRTAVLFFVAIVVMMGVALSMWRPATFPRVRILPEPASTQFEDACGRGVERSWVQGARFWEHEDFVDAVPCPGDVIGAP